MSDDDCMIMITPENIEEIAQAITEANPMFPLTVYYDFAKENMGREMLFSEFMKEIHEALNDAIDDTLLEMVSQGILDMAMNEDDELVFWTKDDSKEENSE